MENCEQFFHYCKPSHPESKVENKPFYLVDDVTTATGGAKKKFTYRVQIATEPNLLACLMLYKLNSLL